MNIAVVVVKSVTQLQKSVTKRCCLIFCLRALRLQSQKEMPRLVFKSPDHKLYTRQRKKRIHCSLQNYNQLRIVDKIFNLEQNPLYFCQLYTNIYRLTILHAKFVLLDCMYLLWTLMNCLRKGSTVHLYQYMVYEFYAFPWRFYVWIVKNRVLCLNQYFAESGSKHLKTVYCFIGINAVVSSAL